MGLQDSCGQLSIATSNPKHGAGYESIEAELCDGLDPD
jgi:hypothetical protein